MKETVVGEGAKKQVERDDAYVHVLRACKEEQPKQGLNCSNSF